MGPEVGDFTLNLARTRCGVFQPYPREGNAHHTVTVRSGRAYGQVRPNPDYRTRRLGRDDERQAERESLAMSGLNGRGVAPHEKAPRVLTAGLGALRCRDEI